jgi:hypothetical protein
VTRSERSKAVMEMIDPEDSIKKQMNGHGFYPEKTMDI